MLLEWRLDGRIYGPRLCLRAEDRLRTTVPHQGALLADAEAGAAAPHSSKRCRLKGRGPNG
jgi:hypothetical protein